MFHLILFWFCWRRSVTFALMMLQTSFVFWQMLSLNDHHSLILTFKSTCEVAAVSILSGPNKNLSQTGVLWVEFLKIICMCISYCVFSCKNSGTWQFQASWGDPFVLSMPVWHNRKCAFLKLILISSFWCFINNQSLLWCCWLSIWSVKNLISTQFHVLAPGLSAVTWGINWPVTGKN